MQNAEFCQPPGFTGTLSRPAPNVTQVSELRQSPSRRALASRLGNESSSLNPNKQTCRCAGGRATKSVPMSCRVHRMSPEGVVTRRRTRSIGTPSHPCRHPCRHRVRRPPAPVYPPQNTAGAALITPTLRQISFRSQFVPRPAQVPSCLSWPPRPRSPIQGCDEVGNTPWRDRQTSLGWCTTVGSMK